MPVKYLKFLLIPVVLTMLTSFGKDNLSNEKLVQSFIDIYNARNRKETEKYFTPGFSYITSSGYALTSGDFFILYNYEKIIRSRTIIRRIESSGDSVKTVQVYPDLLDSLIGKPTYSDQRIYVVKNNKIEQIFVRPLKDNTALMDSISRSWAGFYQWVEKEYPEEAQLLQAEVQNHGATMMYLAGQYCNYRTAQQAFKK